MVGEEGLLVFEALFDGHTGGLVGVGAAHYRDPTKSEWEHLVLECWETVGAFLHQVDFGHYSDSSLEVRVSFVSKLEGD